MTDTLEQSLKIDTGHFTAKHITELISSTRSLHESKVKEAINLKNQIHIISGQLGKVDADKRAIARSLEGLLAQRNKVS